MVLFPQMGLQEKAGGSKDDETQSQTLLQLDSDENLESNSIKDEKKEEPTQGKHQEAASVKAPTDPKYLKKVQINNEKPPVKNIAPPVMRSFVQLSS